MGEKASYTADFNLKFASRVEKWTQYIMETGKAERFMPKLVN